MNTDLDFAGGTRLRIREPHEHPVATLLPGVGSHRFTIRVQVEPVKLAAGYNQVQLAAEVHTEHGAGMRWLGTIPAVTVPLRPDGPPSSADLSMPLTSDQVLALEQERNGQELQLRIEFRASLPQSTDFPYMDRQDTLRVAAGVWEKQVQGVGRAVFFRVAVPLPLDDGPLAKAARHLRQADHQITAGEYPDALRETRLAIGIMRDMKIWPKDVTKKRDDQDQADRYGLMLDRLAEMADGYAGLIQASYSQTSGVQHQDGGPGPGRLGPRGRRRHERDGGIPHAPARARATPIRQALLRR